MHVLLLLLLSEQPRTASGGASGTKYIGGLDTVGEELDGQVLAGIGAEMRPASY